MVIICSKHCSLLGIGYVSTRLIYIMISFKNIERGKGSKKGYKGGMDLIVEISGTREVLHNCF